MTEHDATETAYKNGYKAGFKSGSKMVPPIPGDIIYIPCKALGKVFMLNKKRGKATES